MVESSNKSGTDKLTDYLRVNFPVAKNQEAIDISLMQAVGLIAA